MSSVNGVSIKSVESEFKSINKSTNPFEEKPEEPKQETTQANSKPNTKQKANNFLKKLPGPLKYCMVIQIDYIIMFSLTILCVGLAILLNFFYDVISKFL